MSDDSRTEFSPQPPYHIISLFNNFSRPTSHACHTTQ